MPCTSTIATSRRSPRVCSDARNICLREYGDAPEVRVYGASGLAFPYIPSHLHHIMFELVKNSLRAVADRFENEDVDTDVPPIRVVISQGEEDITIKVRACTKLCTSRKSVHALTCFHLH